MRKLLVSMLIVAALVGAVVAAACAPAAIPTPTPTPVPTPTPTPTPTPAPTPEVPDKIIFGGAQALTGWLAADAETQRMAVEMYIEDMNAAGGIYVPEYDTRIPVELIMYDDKSDPATAAKMYEKLILEDEVHFIIPPYGTAWHFSMAPIADQYGYPLIGTTMTSEQLRSQAVTMPGFFIVEMQWSNIGTDLIALLAEAGVESAASLFVSTLYGIEGAGFIVPRLEVAGIDVVVNKSYPYDMTDFSPLLKDIKAKNPDAVVTTSYLGDALILVEQAITIGLDPKVFWIAFPASDPAFVEKFGTEKLEGLLGQGGWDPHDQATIEYTEKFETRWGRSVDYLVVPETVAMLEILQYSIEKVGLDHEKVIEVLATEKFHTTLWGDVEFVDHYNTLGPTVNQWQGGKYVPITPEFRKIGDLIYPKPSWLD